MQIYRFYVLSASGDPDNYRYVGVTSTSSVKKRFYGHKYCAMHKEKRGLPVHKWMYKHYSLGEDIIVKEIHTCDESQWRSEEVRLIKEYREAGYDLLNVQEGGEGVITKNMRSLSSIERSIKAHELPVYAIDPGTMNVVYAFESTAKAAKALKIKAKTAIGNVLSGRTKKSHGYYWVYKKDWDKGINKVDTSPKKDISKYKLYKFDFDGNFLIKYESLDQFMLIENIHNPSAVKNAAEECRFYLNSFWSFSEELDHYTCLERYYELKEVSPLGKIIQMYHKQGDVSKRFNLYPSQVCIRIKNHVAFPNGNYIERNKN